MASRRSSHAQSGPGTVRKRRYASFLARAVAAVLLAAAAVTGVAAQSGGLQVVIYDPSGRVPVAGVKVTLTSQDRQVASSTLITGKDGIAYFPVLRAVSGYAVDISLSGYARQQIAGIRVRANAVTSVPIRLAPEISEKVVLRERLDTVDLERTATSTRFGEEFLQDLPVLGRFYQDVLKMAAGVQDADGDGNPNVHGARAVDFKAQVDGVSNQDPFTGEWLSFVNPDSIEEIEVITAGAGAEFGRAQGGFASIIQKQGSNDLEGVASVLWRSSLMDGAAASGPGQRIPKYQWIQPSVQVSGPIVRDRLWYRLSHEWIDVEEPVVSIGSIAIMTRKQTIAADQITWQVSPRNKLAFQYRFDPLTMTNVDVSNLIPPESTVREERGGPTYSLTWTAPVSSKVLLDSLVSYQNGYVNFLPSQRDATNDCLVGMANPNSGERFLPSLEQARCEYRKTSRVSGPSPQDWRDRRQRFTAKILATAFLGSFLGMPHELRLGFDSENERYFRTLDRRPTLFFSTSKTTVSIPGQSTPVPIEIGEIDALIAVPERTSARAVGTTVGIYLQDQMKPLRNLTVTLGLRLDRDEMRSFGYEPFDPKQESDEFLRIAEIVPWYERWIVARDALTAYEGIEAFAGNLARALDRNIEEMEGLFSPIAIDSISWRKKRRVSDIDMANNNLSPRFSVAWDPGGEGRTKLAMSAGRYYGALFLDVPVVELGPATTEVRLTATRRPGYPYWQSLTFAAGLNPAVSVTTVDRNLRTPYQDELTLSWERELWPETSLRLTYVRRRYQDQLQDVELNHYPYDYGTCVVQATKFDPWILYVPDGKLDDCEGRIAEGPVHRPDGFADTYLYNPGWGSVYRVGNFNSAHYDGLVVDLVRRQFRNWQMEASYTLSRAVGDAEEWQSPLGDDRTVLENERGYLSYDQRHVVKVNATTVTPWGFRFGTAARWMTGLPYSRIISDTALDSVPPQYPGVSSNQQRARLRYVSGRRNDQRNSPALNIDLKLDKEINLGRGQNLQVTAEVFNLLNDRYYEIYNAAQGWGRQVNGVNEAHLTLGRRYQVGLRLAF